MNLMAIDKIQIAASATGYNPALYSINYLPVAETFQPVLDRYQLAEVNRLAAIVGNGTVLLHRTESCAKGCLASIHIVALNASKRADPHTATLAALYL